MATNCHGQRLENLLDKCAGGQASLILYKREEAPPEYLSYRELRDEASLKARYLQHHHGVTPGRIVLVHLHSHRANIIWFWASILAGGVPAMSTPLVNDRQGRISHLAHLQRLLLDPIVITSQELMDSDFAENVLLHIVAVDTGKIPKTMAAPVAPSLTDDAAVYVPTRGDGSPSAHPEILLNGIPTDATDGHVETLSESIVEDLSTRYGKTASNRFSNEHSKIVSSSGDSTDSSISGQHEATCSGAASDSGYETSANSVFKEEVDGIDSPINGVAKGFIEAQLTSLEGVAALMLTSGSTGNAKAVCLTHEQILTACQGKLLHMPLPQDAVFLNWIGLDHVGSLIELHLTGMLVGCDQVHVPAANVIADPLIFLRLLSKHHVVRTFAPNFFLCKLQQRLDAAMAHDTDGIDLHRLLYLISGGEPNNVNTCVRISEHLRKLGAPTIGTITPGFGMTETCAGSIYSRNCPDVDVHAGTEFAALGKCVPGIEMRVTPATMDTDEGSLEVRGPIVFQRYFNNAEATREAFTQDGWFRTGDTAMIDTNGTLRLVGRSKELIIVNGVKYLPRELEEAIERAEIVGVARFFIVCFAHRPKDTSTEHIFVVYQREFNEDDSEARMDALQAIIRTIVLVAGARPRILPLAPGCLERTTLGKISRAKVRASLLRGEYEDQTIIDTQMLKAYREQHTVEPRNTTERRLMEVFHSLDIGSIEMGIDTTFLDTGVTSIDLVRLKTAAEKSFGITEIPIITVMTNTTIRTLATAIKHLQVSRYNVTYNPVVTLQSNGSKTPLWLVHPGIGEMLVFLGLVQYFPDRPIYAMRARGLNPGEEVFSSLEEVITSYHRAIKAKQPHGPYAIAGYSYGSMLAFEIAKILEADADRVQFLGSFNLPPHIKSRMRRLDWTAGIVHIAHFCSIITEERSDELVHELCPLPHDEQVARLLAESDPQRCADLGLTHAGLHNWTDVSWSLQKMGWEYEPSGDVVHMDIFYCQPLKDVAHTREDYRKNHLNCWVNFVRDDLKFWEVDGEHYTMISPDHVTKFQQILKKALAARGL